MRPRTFSRSGYERPVEGIFGLQAGEDVNVNGSLMKNTPDNPFWDKDYKPTFGSICSGIEAASVAWQPLGWSADWLSEIDKAPTAILDYRFPDTQNLGDMTLIRDQVESGQVVAPEILVGGTPCQAFSVAGARESLNDERGQLTLEYVRLANAIDKKRASEGREPCIAVWENVPGVLSAHDNAFGCFLGALTGCDNPVEPGPRPEQGKTNKHWTWNKKLSKHVPKWSSVGAIVGPQRAVAWRTLDAQHFGLAQRRKRIFVVSGAREGFDPTEILFEWEGVRRDTPPCRKQRQEATADASTSTRATNAKQDPSVAEIKDCISLQDSMIGRKPENGPQGSGFDEKGNCFTLTSADQHAVAYSFDSLASNSMKISNPAGGMKLEPILAPSYGIPGNWIGRKPANGGNAVTPMDNLAPCLTSADQHGVAFAPSDCTTLPINTMTVMGRPSDTSNRMGGGIGKPHDPQNTLSRNHSHAVFDFQQMHVRKLTPVECERLQGFPDNWTLIPYGAKKKVPADVKAYYEQHLGRSLSDTEVSALIVDSARYKVLGNSIAVDVMYFIGLRIDKYMRGLLFTGMPVV